MAVSAATRNEGNSADESRNSDEEGFYTDSTTATELDEESSDEEEMDSNEGASTPDVILNLFRGGDHVNSGHLCLHLVTRYSLLVQTLCMTRWH